MKSMPTQQEIDITHSLYIWLLGNKRIMVHFCRMQVWSIFDQTVLQCKAEADALNAASFECSPFSLSHQNNTILRRWKSQERSRNPSTAWASRTLKYKIPLHAIYFLLSIDRAGIIVKKQLTVTKTSFVLVGLDDRAFFLLAMSNLCSILCAILAVSGVSFVCFSQTAHSSMLVWRQNRTCNG